MCYIVPGGVGKPKEIRLSFWDEDNPPKSLNLGSKYRYRLTENLKKSLLTVR